MSFKLRSDEVREKKKHHGIVHFLAMTAIIVFTGFAIFSIVNDQIEIRENTEKLNKLKAETREVEENNAQITAYLEDEDKLDEYIERMARDKLDYANADERIYYVVPAAE